MAAASSFRGPALGIISLVALAADQLSKHAVEKYTAVGSLRVVIPGLLNLVHTTNPGVAFGLFADSENPWRGPLLIAFSVAVIVMLLWLLATGRAGDVFLCHPFIVHTATWPHRGASPRMIAQPSIGAPGGFALDGSDPSPVARAIVAGLAEAG